MSRINRIQIFSRKNAEVNDFIGVVKTLISTTLIASVRTYHG